MTKKKAPTPEKLQKAREDGAVVYKTMAALVLLCVSLLGLRSMRAYYATLGGYDVLYPMSLWFAILGAAMFAVSAVVLLVSKNRIVRMIMPWIMAVSGFVCITGITMRQTWTNGFPALYFLAGAMLLQYIILLLYRWEFFLFSLSTAGAGFAFYHLSGVLTWNLRTIAILAAVAVILIGTFLMAHGAAKNHGLLVFGKKRIQVLGPKANPTLIYVVDALWLVCIVAAVLLGSLFAYYCMFAAIAVEFIAAVYYTFQLN